MDKDFYFTANPELLGIVFFNLLKNAFQSLNKKSSGKVIVRLGSSNNEGWIVVEDNGLGIDPVQLPYIFEPFKSTHKNGLGLGLYFCKKAMEAMHASIRCHSSPGELTRMILVFQSDELIQPSKVEIKK